MMAFLVILFIWLITKSVKKSNAEAKKLVEKQAAETIRLNELGRKAAESANVFLARPESQIVLDKLEKEKSMGFAERSELIAARYESAVRAEYHNYRGLDEAMCRCVVEVAKECGLPLLLDWRKRHMSFQDFIRHNKLTGEFLIFAESVEKRMRVQQRTLQEFRQKKRQEKTKAQVEQVMAVNQDLIDKFMKIAERKVSMLDEYGEENWDALKTETRVLLNKLNKSGMGGNDYSVEVELVRRFKEYHEAQKTRRTPATSLNELSGVEFETHVGRLLKSSGYEVVGTPATGDQGADLIAKRNNKTIIIQAKRYQGTVGNKAVQEVIAALAYYGGDEGWVVTNSTFTPSAVELAQKGSVRLIDGSSLSNFSEVIE